MKRTAIIVIAALVAASTVSAQAWGGRGAIAQNAIEETETIKVEGKLSLINGFMAVETGGKTYYVSGLQRLIGFVDGLKEGASVKLEGYSVEIPAAPEYAHLRVAKLTVNGKDYDLSANAPAMGGNFGGNMGGKGVQYNDFGPSRSAGGRGRR